MANCARPPLLAAVRGLSRQRPTADCFDLGPRQARAKLSDWRPSSSCRSPRVPSDFTFLHHHSNGDRQRRPLTPVASCSYTTLSQGHFVPRETIFALASGSGRAGVAIIRVSGRKSSSIYFDLCRTSSPKPYSRLPPSHKLVLRDILHPGTGEILDAGAAVIYFPENRSYTGEESLELHVHGGLATVADILDVLGSLSRDIRPAEPGEFTRRAFENGRLDLTSSEALHELISAETSVQRQIALQGAGGLQTQRYQEIRQRLLESMALVEALIDFSDEDGVEEGTWDAAKDRADGMRALIRAELGIDASSQTIPDSTSAVVAKQKRQIGEILTQGIRLAIYGPPNAGKSSLLNRLADRKAAIVSPIPGTTRDVLNVSLDVGGYKVVVYDTAGLREGGDLEQHGHRTSLDEIEAIGIERAREAVEEADLALLVVPATMAEEDADIEILRPGSYREGDPDLVFVNKTDLAVGSNSSKDRLHEVAEQSLIWKGSVLTGDGIDELVRGLTKIISERYALAQREPPLITQTRHRFHLQECLVHLDQFRQLAEDDTPDLVVAAEELRYAAKALGKVTGIEVSPDEILGNIFSTFCIGK